MLTFLYTGILPAMLTISIGDVLRVIVLIPRSNYFRLAAVRLVGSQSQSSVTLCHRSAPDAVLPASVTFIRHRDEPTERSLDYLAL